MLQENADKPIYVFCVHMLKDQETINPLDLSQLESNVLNTKVLNEKVPMQKTITLNRLIIWCRKMR